MPKNTFANFTPEVVPFTVMSAPQNTCYKVVIDEDFEHPKQFQEIVDALDSADEGDYMAISLTTNGGALHAVIPLLCAIENTMCHVHIHAISDVASAGTFLLMRADSVFINDYTTIMCHNVSFGAAGSGHTVASLVSHTLKSSEKLLRDMYSGFFNESELLSILCGKDFYLDKDDFMARYVSREVVQKAEWEAEQESLKETPAPSKPKRVRKPLNIPTIPMPNLAII